MESPQSLAHIIREGTQEERDHYGELFVRFLFEGPRLTGMLHADPHPGNFLVGGDGVLTVIDFGACIKVPDGLPRPLIELVAAVVDGRRADLKQLALEHGYLAPEHADEVSAGEIEAFLAPFAEPLAEDDFVFTVEWLTRVLGPFLDPKSPQSQLSRSFGSSTG